MRIKLPFKKLSYDGKKHRMTLEIILDTTQEQELMDTLNETQADKAREHGRGFKKKKAGGLRKCLGHKFPKTPRYDEDGRCSICGGFKY